MNQEKFLSNTHNKKQFINILSSELRDNDFKVKQSTGDADTEIVNAAIEHPYETTIITQDTDILVLTIALSPSDKNTYVFRPKIGRSKPKLYSAHDMQKQHSNIRNYILIAHAFSGCDTTSAIFGKGKKQLLRLFESERGLQQSALTFSCNKSTHADVSRAGEIIFMYLYGSKLGSFANLDDLRFHLFQKSLKRTHAKLESLPPTSAAAAQHSFRCFYQVQFWKGNPLNPEKWGWTRINGLLEPIRTTLPPAPDEILNLVSCACTGNCSTAQCGCKKSGVQCSPLCKNCGGGGCFNFKEEHLNDDSETEDENEDNGKREESSEDESE